MLEFSQTRVCIEGVETELLFQQFADRYFVLITQLGKMGHVIQVSLPSTGLLASGSSSDHPDSEESLPALPEAIHTTSLFGATSGNAGQLHSLYASQAATLVWHAEMAGAQRRSVVVAVALRKFADIDEMLDNREASRFHGIMKALRGMLQQS